MKLKQWYGGYCVGVADKCDVFNPWSVLAYLNGNRQLVPRWTHTSSAELLDTIILK